jgi:hypothetical protein
MRAADKGGFRGQGSKADVIDLDTHAHAGELQRGRADRSRSRYRQGQGQGQGAGLGPGHFGSLHARRRGEPPPPPPTATRMTDPRTDTLLRRGSGKRLDSVAGRAIADGIAGRASLRALDIRCCPPARAPP